MALSFAFGGDSGISYEELKRRRAIADALGAKRSAPKDVGEGLSEIGRALGYRLENARLNKVEAAGKAEASSLFDSIASGMGGGAAPVAAPSIGAQAAPAPAAASGGGDIRSGILETANALGVDPVDLATTISYETAGTFDPTKAGPTTQWGQHKGLIQFGEPQAAKYGVDWSNPIGSQLGADGAVAKYLRDTGVKPGMGLLDIYSAINAGGVGRYRASDANNGGAPGTVADKVNNQMAGHRAKAMALLGDLGANGASAAIENQMAPQQVASADPSFMPEQTPDPRAAIAQAMAQQAPQQPQDPWQGMREPNATQAAPEAVQRVAQAMPAQSGGVDQRLIQAISNPYMSDGQKQVLGALLKQQLAANQPMSPLEQVQMRKLQIETELLQNPRLSPNEAARLEFDREQMEREERKLTNVPAGTTVFDPATRQPVFTAPTKPDTLSPDALAQQLQLREAGRSSVNVDTGANQGALEKKLGEGLGTTFNSFIEEGVNAGDDIAQIDRLDGLLKNNPGGLGAGLQAMAAKYGVALGENASDVQAADAIISALIPRQRVPGSGTSSDRDIETFRKSLPSIMGTPEGNAEIVQTMRGLAQQKQRRGEIAMMVATGQMSASDALKEIGSMPSPFAGTASAPHQQSSPPPGNYRWNPDTGQMEPM